MQLKDITKICADITIILSLIFAIYQVNLFNKTEKRRISIEAVGSLSQPEFLRAYVSLQAIQNQNKLADDDINNLNHVMSVYSSIATLYLNNDLDKTIIREFASFSISNFSNVLDNIYSNNKYLFKNITFDIYKKQLNEFIVLLNKDS